MFLIQILSLIVLACPFLIFLDYHKRKNIHWAIIYVIVFFSVVFILSKVIYHYGMVLAIAAPFLILVICLIRKKPTNSKEL